MNANEYLVQVLAGQNLDDGSPEINEIQSQRKKVEKLLREKYGASPHIRYGGSKAKGTMNSESYDLDIHCYFDRDDTTPGETLEEIYNDVWHTLETEYYVTLKRTALRLKCKDENQKGVDLHIDVVPGRYIDGEDGDVFVYQKEGDKCRLQTNLVTHVRHIRDSGVRDAIRLIKLWNVRNGIHAKTFVLELLVVELLKDHKTDDLTEQLTRMWTVFRDEMETLNVVDPANTNNDLKPILDEKRSQLSYHAKLALRSIGQTGWHSLFGSVEFEDDTGKDKRLENVIRAIPSIARYKPYYHES